MEVPIIVLGKLLKGVSSQIGICGGIVAEYLAYVASRFSSSKFLPLL